MKNAAAPSIYWRLTLLLISVHLVIGSVLLGMSVAYGDGGLASSAGLPLGDRLLVAAVFEFQWVFFPLWMSGVLSLSATVTRLRQGRLPARLVVIHTRVCLYVILAHLLCAIAASFRSPFSATGMMFACGPEVILVIGLSELVACIPVWLVAVGYLRDSRRGNPGVCASCGHNLRGLPTGSACPECGKTNAVASSAGPAEGRAAE